MSSINVFNADDHPILRKGVTELLKETTDMKWVGSAENGKDALDKIRAIQPDIAILDIEMPGYTGIEVARILLKEGTKTNFIVLTLFKDEDFFHSAIEVGIKGYLLKESSEKDILNCIRSVHRGQLYVNSDLTYLLHKQPDFENDRLGDLSAHEVNILKLIAMQKTTAEIASMLFITPKTVSNHRGNISKKLALSGQQNGLLKWAIENKDVLSH
ncbi:MAG: DNA-binding NarL/FixJ family response regulator [Polaribacter sp.]|jgi:DNA-binding NarL/FixJ family response regulator